MPSLNCPHCNGRVSANPLGRWYSKFSCPHCGKALRFDAKTNLLGAIASACFVATGIALIMVMPPHGTTVVAVGAAAWIVLMGLSYALRGIEKG